MNSETLLAELDRLPQEWPLCCVRGDKKPFHPDQKYLPNGKPDPTTPDWKTPLPRHRIMQEIQRGKCLAVGMLTGEVSDGIMAVDHDGLSCDPLIEKLSGLSIEEALPKTSSFTSGKEGRYQHLYQVPECFWPYLQSKTIFTGVKDSSKKEEQLDLRWNGKQSVVIGNHPETEGYRCLPNQAPWEVEVADCPMWIIRQMLSFRSLLPKNRKDWSDRDWALEYLSYIPNQDLDWYEYRNILLGLHYAEVEEEVAWVWSASSEKHTNEGFEAVWKYIDDDCANPIRLGTLGELAKQGGWKGKPPSSHSQSGEDDFDSTYELKAETDNLLNQSSQNFDLKDIFPKKLATPLNAIAKVFNQPPVAVAAPLLSIAGSLLRVGTLIRIQVRSDFAQPSIVWVAEVGDSDSGKSPIIALLKKPLSSLQLDNYKDYLKRKEDYEWDLAEWDGAPKKDRGPKPKLTPMRQFLFDDFTTEAIAESLQHHPDHGALVCVDELAAMLYGFNQYKKRGNDRQRWLSLYDGAELNISRKTQEPIYLSRTNLPIVGGIQPVVLRDVIGDLEHVDGFWPRFYYVRMPLTMMPSVDWHNDTDTGLDKVLSKAYLALDNLPAKTYCLSQECQEVWDDWHHWTEQERFNEPHPALRALYRKARARAARVALVVHCLNAVVEDKTPTETISSDTLIAAIAFTRYGVNQIRSIYADFGVVDNPEASRITRFLERFQGAGWIEWLKVRRWWNSTEKPNKEECLKFMTQLVSLGYARDNGQSDKNYQIQVIDLRQNVKTAPQPAPNDGSTFVKDLVKLTKPLVKKLETEAVFDETLSQNDLNFDETQSHASQRFEPNFDYLTKNFQKKSQNESEIPDPWLEEKVVTEPPQPKLKLTDYWRTPNTDEQPILTKVSEVLDGIGLDPTADDAKSVPASHHFTQDDNCLDKSWEDLGPVFMNPPFSKPLPFVEKLVQEYQAGHTSEAITLLKAGTLHNKGTGSLIWSSASAVCHWGCGKARRIAYLDAAGNPAYGADFDCVLVYWGSKQKHFKEVFQHYGNVSFNDSESSNDEFSHLVTNNLQPITQEDLSLVKELVNSSQTLVKPSHELVTDPRQACTISNGRVDVDLSLLDLNYQPETPIPNWEPTKELKPYQDLSKLYIDIETLGLNAGCDRVISIGLMNEKGEATLISDPDEKALLQEVMGFLTSNKPELLVGHNLFQFDLPFLMQRCKLLRIRHPFISAGKTSRITSASVHGKPIEFTHIYWRGVDIIDTYHQVGIYDKSKAVLSGYSLKDSVLTLGLRADRRLELSANQIKDYWNSGNFETIHEYLRYDLEDTSKLAGYLLPIIYYQKQIVPELSLQQLAVASPALKWEKIIESFYSSRPEADPKKSYGGGYVSCTPGLYRNAAKIDVSSLYPSLMLQYQLCSQKDTKQAFLSVLQYLKAERLRLKRLAKAGDTQADQQQNALKILLNSGYGYLGTQGYSFNDYEAAALITGYGQKLIKQMTATVEAKGGAIAEVDTDGIIFSHDNPQMIAESVKAQLPEGIDIDLDWTDRTVYVPKMKSYLIFEPNGVVKRVGEFRKRNRSRLQTDYPVEYLRHYLDSPENAEAYHHQLLNQIQSGQLPLEWIRVTEKIRKGDKRLIGAGLGKEGDKVTYYLSAKERVHKRTAKALNSVAVPTTKEPYFAYHYCKEVEQMHRDLLKVLKNGCNSGTSDTKTSPISGNLPISL